MFSLHKINTSRALTNLPLSQDSTLTPDICQFLGTTGLFSPVKVHPKVRESETNYPKLAKVEKKATA